MKRIRFIISLVLLCSCLPNVAAQDSEAGDPDADSRIKALLKEHEESELGYTAAYEKFKPRFEMFAEAHRGTEAEARAILWLIQQAWWLRSEGEMEETSFPLAEDLLKRHPKSKHLHLLVEYQYVFTRDQRREIFNKLIEVSPHSSVKAAAHFGLARLEAARNAEGEPNKYFKALLNEYADEKWRLTTFGAIANAYVNPHSPEDLAVGKRAPEIVGIDHEGNPMKLSDFRGKVVMLDFWGHW